MAIGCWMVFCSSEILMESYSIVLIGSKLRKFWANSIVVPKEVTSQTTVMNIICMGYYWPQFFKDAYALIRDCKECHFYDGKCKNVTMPLRPIVVDEPFAQWGMDLIGMINPISSIGHKWIMMATDYFTCWTEAVPLKNFTELEIVNFLEGLVTHFGSPKTIISDNTREFTGSKVTQFTLDHNIYLKTSSNYYLQGMVQLNL